MFFLMFLLYTALHSVKTTERPLVSESRSLKPDLMKHWIFSIHAVVVLYDIIIIIQGQEKVKKTRKRNLRKGNNMLSKKQKMVILFIYSV